MPKELPYYRWYPSDAESDELYASLTDQELGFFHRCLNRAWVNCGLPSDLDQLAATMRVTRKYLDKVWAKVGRCFVLTDTVHQRLVNPRQEQERQHALSKSERATDSVRSRYERRTNDVPRAQARAECASASVSEEVKIPKVREISKAPIGGRFEEWISVYPRKADKDAAARAWISVVTSNDEAAAFACRDRYLASDEVSRGVVMEAANFIFQQGRNKWEGDWPKARDSPTSGTKPSITDAVKALAIKNLQERGRLL